MVHVWVNGLELTVDMSIPFMSCFVRVSSQSNHILCLWLSALDFLNVIVPGTGLLMVFASMNCWYSAGSVIFSEKIL